MTHAGRLPMMTIPIHDADSGANGIMDMYYYYYYPVAVAAPAQILQL
jgi:hypothetical protein